MHDGSITFRLLAEVNHSRQLRRLVELFGELHEIPGRALHAVQLALDEVVCNSLRHALAPAGGRELLVRMELAGPILRGEVVDEGLAFNPLEAPAPDVSAPLSDRPLGGLGVYLVRSVMDQVAYRREGSKNVLTMSKRIG